MKRILAFLALASCAIAGTWIASPGKGSHGAGGAAPINQWFYAGTGNTDASFTSTIPAGANIHLTTRGAPVTFTGAGTVTHLGMNIFSNSGSTDFEIALYDPSNNLVVAGSAITLSSGSPAWSTIDVTDTAVTAGTYNVMISASTNQGLYNYLNTQNGLEDDVVWASFPPASLTSPTTRTNELTGVRAFVTNKTIAAYRSVANTTYASRTNTTITKPTGVADGDVMIMMFIIGAAGTPPTPTLPAGWTVIQGPTTQSAGGFQVTRRLAWKVASSEGADYTVTHSAGSSQGAIVAVQNASSASIVSSNNGGTGSTTTATGITPSVDQSLIIFMAHNWVLYGTGLVPTGDTPVFTERLDSATSIIYVATGVLGTAAATGNKTHANLNTASDGWGAFLVSVGP